jgi:UDP-3-O-[3-hydroxymyristoyl] glucosamine N-acyltransferase
MAKIDQFYFLHPNITIHTPIDSPCRVDKKCVVFKNIFGFLELDQKILKTAF